VGRRRPNVDHHTDYHRTALRWTHARSFAEDIVEISTTTGTGAYTLAGPKGDYFPFEAEFVTGDKPVYVVRNYSNSKIEFNRVSDLQFDWCSDVPPLERARTGGNASNVEWADAVTVHS